MPTLLKRPLITLFGRDLLKEWQCYLSSSRYRQSVKRLLSYKNKHLGERCCIIGNGPSLKTMDLSPLKGEITFGLNRIYLLYDQIDFTISYFVSVNQYVIEQCAEEICRLVCPKFISWEARHLIPFTSDMMFVRPIEGPRFCTDVVRQGVWEGATVTNVALQLAYYMGFQQVILIGVDHAFQTKGSPNQVIVSEQSDQDHFHPDYFGQGFRWQLPDLETSELAYRIAKYKFAEAGREIIDATAGGKLQVFRKADFHTLF